MTYPLNFINYAVWPDGDYYNIDEQGFESYCLDKSDDYTIMSLPPELEANLDDLDELALEFANITTLG